MNAFARPGDTLYLHRITMIAVARPSETARTRDARLSQQMAEFRLATALELHDGILQTLTGAAFQIAVAKRVLREDPDRAEEVLAELGRSVAAEQREMRLFVDEIRGSPPFEAGWDGLAARIDEMLDRVSAAWGIQASAEVSLPEGLAPETERTVFRIVQEATLNTARHGGARSVQVRACTDDGAIHLEVGDDGHGFPFQGEFDDRALKERRLGPLSLKHRVAAAGGTIAIASSHVGAIVSMRIPLVLEERE
jgi:signal transduction histidine kinase